MTTVNYQQSPQRTSKMKTDEKKIENDIRVLVAVSRPLSSNHWKGVRCTCKFTHFFCDPCKAALSSRTLTGEANMKELSRIITVLR